MATIEVFTSSLQSNVLPQAKGRFAAGRDLFDEILRENHIVDYDADQLLETGWQQFQFVWANRQETIPRRMGFFLATLFIEGWAFYCEELMEHLGYITDPVQRLGRLSDQLWRWAAGRCPLA